MGLIAAIVSYLLGTGSNLLDLARRIGNAFGTLWDTLTAFFSEIATAAAHIAGGGVALVVSLSRFALTLAWALPWILFTYIPAQLSNLLGQLTSWVIYYVGKAVDAVQQDLSAFASWARDQVNQLLALWRQLLDELVSDVANLWGVLNWVKDRVTMLLTDPTALATWLLFALFAVAKQWIEANLVALARWGMGIAVSGTIRAAPILEDIIVKVI